MPAGLDALIIGMGQVGPSVAARLSGADMSTRRQGATEPDQEKAPRSQPRFAVPRPRPGEHVADPLPGTIGAVTSKGIRIGAVIVIDRLSREATQRAGVLITGFPRWPT